MLAGSEGLELLQVIVIAERRNTKKHSPTGCRLYFIPPTLLATISVDHSLFLFFNTFQTLTCTRKYLNSSTPPNHSILSYSILSYSILSVMASVFLC
jgi:hypothetical protein